MHTTIFEPYSHPHAEIQRIYVCEGGSVLAERRNGGHESFANLSTLEQALGLSAESWLSRRLQDGRVPCASCGCLAPSCEELPPLEDDERWDDLAAYHHVECPWATSRGFRAEAIREIVLIDEGETPEVTTQPQGRLYGTWGVTTEQALQRLLAARPELYGRFQARWRQRCTLWLELRNTCRFPSSCPGQTF